MNGPDAGERGPFRARDLSAFKDELHKKRLDLLTWSAFHEARSRRRAVQWLVGNSLIDDAAANQFLASHRADSINRAYSILFVG